MNRRGWLRSILGGLAGMMGLGGVALGSSETLRERIIKIQHVKGVDQAKPRFCSAGGVHDLAHVYGQMGWAVIPFDDIRLLIDHSWHDWDYLILPTSATGQYPCQVNFVIRGFDNEIFTQGAKVLAWEADIYNPRFGQPTIVSLTGSI